MNMPLGDFQRGGAAQAPLSMANQKVAFNICYEDGFGDELIASAKQASLLANVSNLGWFIRSNAVHQHLQISQTRALELGRYMVRATNTGATAIINPQGQVVKLAPPDTRTVLEGNIEGVSWRNPVYENGRLAAIGVRFVVFGRIADAGRLSASAQTCFRCNRGKAT